MSLDSTDDQSTMVQVMAWCHQATSHYLNQCWPRSLSPYGITRPQWVNERKQLQRHETNTPQGVHGRRRDHSGYVLSQWEMTLNCNIISHWLSPCPDWSLIVVSTFNTLCTEILIEAERCINESVNWPALIQIMVSRLTGAKPLSEPLLENCQLDPWEQTSVRP